MKISPIYFYNFALITAILFVASASAHSVHDGSAHQEVRAVSPHHNLEVAGATKKKTVAELIQQYSMTGNDELLAQGWALLKVRLNEPVPLDWLHAAWLAQAEHRFDDANVFVKKVLDAQPRNAQALLLQASIAMVQGNAQLAKHSCQLVSIVVDPVVGYACLARLNEERDDQEIALKRLLAMPLTVKDAALRTWVTMTIAELAVRLNEKAIASRYFKQSLSLQPLIQTRVAYADLLLSDDQPSEVLILIDEKESAPALVLRRLIALQELGRDISDLEVQYDERFRQWHAEQDYRHAREMAMFYMEVLPDNKLARVLAKENLVLQQEPEDKMLYQRSMGQF